MQRNQNPGQSPRRNAERDAAQPIAGQPRTDEEDEALEDPERVPSFLTARELQARDPAKAGPAGDEGGDRHANAEFAGEHGEPAITDDEPPRGKRGLPMDRSDELKGGKRKPK